MRKSKSSSARIDNPRLFPACFGGFAIRRQLPISDLQSASSNGARTKKYQFRRISNPQRNRSNLFCLRISNPQERLRRIEAPACFGGFQIRKEIGRTFFVCGFQIRRNAYGGLKPPLVSADLQSAASYLFQFRRICNPPPVTYSSFGGFAIRRRTGNYCGFVIR